MVGGTATLTFDDEFNTLSLWNGTSGTWDSNYWYNPLSGNGGTLSSNGEQEWYINSNDPATSSVVPWTVSNGVLEITAAKAPSSIQPLIDNYQYTSGELNTYHSFSQTYGYFEMSAELPAGQGLWPAFWLLPANGSWPPELDIMEVLGNNPTELYTTVHSEVSGSEVNNGIGTAVANMSTGFHTYAVDWEPNTITWYFDGQEVYQVATPADMNQPMYVMVNLAAGGSWPGDVDATTPLPATMKIDWIRVYSSDPYDGSAGTSTTPGSLGGTTSAGSLSASTTDGDATVGASTSANSGTGAGTATSTGVTLTANNMPHQVLTGTAGDDTFYAGHSSVIMTGAGGSDTFVFDYLPQSAGQITDFNPMTDKIDVTALLHAEAYAGSNPFGDGTLSLASDGNGGTELAYHSPGSGRMSSVPIVDLEHVAPSAIDASTDFIIGTQLSGAVPDGTDASGSGDSWPAKIIDRPDLMVPWTYGHASDFIFH